MNRQLADKLNASGAMRRGVSTRFPQETIELATTVTILGAPDANPIGWSLRRFLQRRGNVVITDRRVVVESSFRSPLTIIWVVALLFAAYELASGFSWEWVFLALTAGILVFQRRPYSRNIPFSELKGVRFGNVRGVSGHADIVALNLGETALHLVMCQFVPEELKRQMESRIGAFGADCEQSGDT